MENLRDIGFEQLIDASAVASKGIGLTYEWFPTDSSSLSLILAHIQSIVPARPSSSESSGQVIVLFGAGASFTSLRERSIDTSASVPGIAMVAEAVFTTSLHDSREIARAKLRKLKAKRFSKEGQESRVARALEILSLPPPNFRVDKETWVWAAEDADIEDI
jgi:hypothetical protein